MKKLIALGLLVSSLLGISAYAQEIVNGVEEGQIEELNIEDIKKEIKKQVLLEAKAVGKDLTQEELDEAVEVVLNMLAYLAEQQDEMSMQDNIA